MGVSGQGLPAPGCPCAVLAEVDGCSCGLQGVSGSRQGGWSRLLGGGNGCRELPPAGVAAPAGSAQLSRWGMHAAVSRRCWRSCPAKVHGPAPVAVLTLASACLPAASGAGQRVGMVGPLHQARLLALAASHGACWCFWPGSMGAVCPQLALLPCAQAVWYLTLPLLLTAPCSHLPVLQRAGAGIESLPRYSGEPSITLPGSCLPGASTLLAAPASLCLPCWGSRAGSRCPCTQPVVRLKVGSQRHMCTQASVVVAGMAGRHTQCSCKPKQHPWPHPAHLSGRSR